MSADPTRRLGRHLRRAVRPADREPLTDGQLLERFLSLADDSAFEELVRRHGPMVLGVCRRVLGNAHDAEDSFQASFLVVVRKARQLTPRVTIGNWLHGVAYHTALKARAAAMKRRARETRAAQRRGQETTAPPDWLPLLDQELNRLPEKYRLAVVLCDLEDRPRKEVAVLLGVPEGTLSSRLSTARKKLAGRLGRLGLPATALAPTLVPPALLDATVQAAGVIAGHSGGGIVPAAIVALTEEVTRSMFLSRLRIGALVLLVLLLGAGAALSLPGRATPSGPVPRMRAAPQAKKRAPKPEPLPAWKQALVRDYRLAGGEDLKRVGLPFPASRMDYYRIEMAFQAKVNSFAPVSFAFTWTGRQLKFRSAVIGQKGGEKQGITLGSILDVVGVPPQFVDAPEDLRSTLVTGDWVVRDGVKADKLVPRLEQILSKECNLAVKLTFKEVEREVAVARGKFRSNPRPGRKANNIDLFALQPVPNSGAGGGSGTLEEFFRAAGSFVHLPILNEVKQPPKGILSWYFHVRSPMIKNPGRGIDTRAEDTAPRAVLPNVAAQTGLEIAFEKRKVRVLFVERREKP